MSAHDDAGQLTLRLRQWAQRAERLEAPVPGRFLAGDERSAALREARQAGVKASFDGGWPEAERVQVCFHPEDTEPVFTGQWLRIRWNGRFARVDHRDLLGSLMALGMDRAYFGDLIAQEGEAFLLAMPEVACRLPQEWVKAGNAPIRVDILDEPPAIQPPEGAVLRDTVASLRLDSVLASGMKTSRARAAEMIRQGAVSVEHLPEERVDRLLTAGQTVSVRGFGRVRLQAVGAPTRKDRLPVILEIFAKS